MANLDFDLEEVKESRFAHLLKPIRDLKDSFGLDIAHELGEYLEQLGNTTFDLCSNGRAVDFAEAALLIQGSTCIYSKKVDYLHMLVYQALEAVKGCKQQQQQADVAEAGPTQPGPRGRKAAARDADGGLELAEPHYFDTGPFVESQVDEDLAPGEGRVPDAGNAMRMPATLLALEDHGQSAATSTNVKGDGDSGVYRLQQCFIHSSGTLMLDPQDADKYDDQARYIGPQQRKDLSLEQLLEPFVLAAGGAPAPRPPGPNPDGPQTTQDRPHNQGDAAGSLDMNPGAQGQDPQAAGGFDGFNDDDGGGYGAGGDWPSDDEAAVARPDGEVGGECAGEQDGAAAVVGGGETAAAGNRRPTRNSDRVTDLGPREGAEEGQEQDQEEQEEFDPWKPLDPNERCAVRDRPIKVRKPAGKVEDVWDKSNDEACPTFPAAAEALAVPVPDGFPLPEFAYCLAWLRPAAHIAVEVDKAEEAKKAAKEQRKKEAEERKQRFRDAADGPIFEAKDVKATAADEPDDDDPANRPPSAAPPPYGFDDDNDDGGGFGGGASDLDDDPAGRPGGADGCQGAGLWGEDGFDPEAGTRPPDRTGMWPGVPVPAMGGLDDDMAVDGGEGKTFEELCRQHMEAMIAAAVKPELQTDLARRVNNWKERIHPLLKAEESRPGFDIQDYGERLLTKLSQLQVKEAEEGAPAQDTAKGPSASQGPLAPFSHVSAGLEPYEVPRMFSAMLQLINNRNLAICKTASDDVPPGQVPDEPFTLQLLSTEMYHRTMGAKLSAKHPLQQQLPAFNGGADHEMAGAGPPSDNNGEYDDPSYGENRPSQGLKGGAKGTSKAGGRGKGAGGGAKRAKKAAPLSDANFDDDD